MNAHFFFTVSLLILQFQVSNGRNTTPAPASRSGNGNTPGPPINNALEDTPTPKPNLRTTPPRLPFPTTTTTTTTTTTKTQPNTPPTQANTPNKADTPSPTPAPTPPDTPPPQGDNNNLPNTPTPRASLPTTPVRPNSLPSTPDSQGGNNLPSTPAPASLPTTPQTRSTTTGRTLPTTAPAVQSTPEPNVVTGASTLISTPAQATPTPLPTSTTQVVTTQPTSTTTTVVQVVTTQPASSTSVSVITTPLASTTTATPANIITTPSVSTTTTTTPTIDSTTTTMTTTMATTTTSPTNPSTFVSSNSPSINPTPTTTFFTPPTPSLPTTTFPPTTTSLIPLSSRPLTPSDSVLDNQPINVVFLFCNNFPDNEDPIRYIADLKDSLVKMVKEESPNFDESRIKNFRIQQNTDNGKLSLLFTLENGDDRRDIPNSRIVNLVREKGLMVNGRTLNFDCDNNRRVITWRENWACLDRTCENGGFCYAYSTGRLTCQCPSGYAGRYCEHNLWLLLILLGLFVLIAMVVLCWCLYFRKRKRVFVKKVVDKSIEEAVVEPKEKERPKPLQTFYLPYNKPLSVGFSNAQVGTVGLANGLQVVGTPVVGLQNNGGLGLQAIGMPTVGVTGLASNGLGNGTTVLPVGVLPTNQAVYPTINSSQNPDTFYQTVGQNMALAFNDYTFMPNPRSSMIGNPVYQGTSNRNYNSLFKNTPDNMANDGAGYYHSLGQRLAIKFDSTD